jgi:hypothetical protein
MDTPTLGSVRRCIEVFPIVLRLEEEPDYLAPVQLEELRFEGG